MAPVGEPDNDLDYAGSEHASTDVMGSIVCGLIVETTMTGLPDPDCSITVVYEAPRAPSEEDTWPQHSPTTP